MRRTLRFVSIAALIGVCAVSSANAVATCDITVGVDDGNAANDRITTNTTWSGTVCLEAPIFVASGAVLTIQPGTIVRGQPRQVAAGGLAGSPGALLVSQGGKLVADGSPSAPIIFTTGAMDNNADGTCDDVDADTFFDDFPGIGGSSEWCDDNPQGAPLPPLMANGKAAVKMWGGLVLNGKAPTNLGDEQPAPAGIGQGFVEGVTLPGVSPTDALCGGVEPHDSSGILRYVSVRHGGDEFDLSNELNGITLCAVGDNTIIEFVEVYANFDDGIEIFGGTPHLNHVVVAYAGDDQLDIDWGYTGSIQYAFTIMPFFNNDDGSTWGSLSGDKLGEFDGDDYFNTDAPSLDRNVTVRTAYSNAVFPGDPRAQGIDTRDVTQWPMSAAYIANWTGIGTTLDGGNTSPPVSAASTNLGVQMRQGFAGQVVNSLFVNTSGACLVVDTSSAGPNFDAPTGQEVFDHVSAGTVRWTTNSCDGSSALAGGATSATGAADNGDTFSQFDTNSEACALNIRATGGGFTGLVDENPNFNGKVFAGGSYDPRPNGAGADCGVTPRLPGLDRTRLRGAFAPAVPLWTDRWTVLDQAGVL